MLLLILALLTAATSVEDDISAARILYENLQYESCIGRLNQSATKSAPPELQAQAELIHGLCLVQLSDLDQASVRFRIALQFDPSIELPPFSHPRARALLEEERVKLHPPVPLSEAEPEPAPPLVTTPSPPPAHAPEWTPAAPALARSARSPALRAVPWILGGAAVVGGTTSIVFLSQARSLAKEANQSEFESTSFALGEKARARQKASQLTAVAAGVFALGAVVTSFLISEAP